MKVWNYESAKVWKYESVKVWKFESCLLVKHGPVAAEEAPLGGAGHDALVVLDRQADVEDLGIKWLLIGHWSLVFGDWQEDVEDLGKMAWNISCLEFVRDMLYME